jgi:hypothetical protein
MHQIEVKLAVAANPSYFLITDDGDLPTAILEQGKKSRDEASRLFTELITGVAPIHQAGFYELDDRKIVLYTAFMPERVPTRGRWVSVEEDEFKELPYNTFLLLMQAINYRGQI